LKALHRYILFLVMLNVLIAGGGYFLISITNLNIKFSDIIILGSLFSVIALISLVIFFRGQTKDPESQTMHSLVSIVLKFLLEMVLALVWFIVAKKTSLPSVLLFFVLYLSLTLFTVLIMLRTLKNKSL
jgi:hypothetical protein